MPIIQLAVVNGDQLNADSKSKPSVRPNPPGTINLPTARPSIAQPTARPTFSVSFTRSLATSFSFASTAWTGISFTRTIQTSFTVIPTFTLTTTYPQYWYPGMGFWHYGTGYSASTGAFTLGQTLYDQNNNPCLYYSYFEFNAPAGLSITAQVWTTGSPVHVIVLPMMVISQFESPSSCSELGQRAVNLLSQIQSFGSTPYTLTWTAPQDGQYAIVFFSKTPYGNTVYFLPQ
jgi:hypothetical protein